MDNVMEHPRIDDEKVIDRYLAGRLPEAEVERFEEHLFECAECLEQVEWGEELQRGLQTVAAEDVAKATVSAGLIAWLRQHRRLRLGALALACLALPAIFLWQQFELGRLRGELQLARQQTPDGAGLREPLSNVSIVPFGVVRDTAEPVEIRLASDRKAVLLSLELPAVEAASYRVTLLGTDREVLWRGEELEPTPYDTLWIAMPTSYLQPDLYRILVEAHSAAGLESAGEIAFRVVATESASR